MILDLVKKFEGCKLTAYKDPASKNGLPITIAYGNTMYTDGSKIKLGDIITQQKADELLQWAIDKKTNVIKSMNLHLDSNQFDAITSFVYNCGIGAFEKSTMLKKIKINPNDETIRHEFMRFINVDGVVNKGLIRRRKLESDLYYS